MADLAGRLSIQLERGGAGLGVSIVSSRPVSASRVFVGRTIDETVSALPTLYSICATAQAAACVGACEAAIGLEPGPGVLRARRWLVDAETVKERLWRILLDWPRFSGSRPDGPVMARVLTSVKALSAVLSGGASPFLPGAEVPEPDRASCMTCLDDLSAVTAEKVLGVGHGEWLEDIQNSDRLLAWAQEAPTTPACVLRELIDSGQAGFGRSAVAPLPPLRAADLELHLGGAAADRFVAFPVWNGQPADCSPLVRVRGHAAILDLEGRFGNGLLTRLAAQLLDLALLLEGLQEGIGGSQGPALAMADSPGVGVGIAQVEAARGLLIHRVAVAGERVRDYRILAPTEWNFHPRGAVALGLSVLPAADERTLSHLAGLFATAVDPCVEYDVTFRQPPVRG